MSVVTLATRDGLELSAWYRPAASARAPTLVYLHGNAGHIGHRGTKVRPYLDAGYGVLLVSWRGYGGNPGRPNEAGLYADARAGLDFLQEKGIPEALIVIYGESIGSGPAIQMATERAVGAVVLEAPFTSLGALAQTHYWYLPARVLVRDKFANLDKIAQIGAPLLIVHGERDRVTPVALARQLFAAASEPKQVEYIGAAGHNDLYDHGAARAVIAFIGSELAPQ